MEFKLEKENIEAKCGDLIVFPKDVPRMIVDMDGTYTLIRLDNGTQTICRCKTVSELINELHSRLLNFKIVSNKDCILSLK